MALDAIDAAMFSGQREIGFIVAEVRYRFPSRHGMAFQTILTELPTVMIHMATQAFPAKAHKGAVWVFIRLRQCHRTFDVFFSVTFPAFDTGMLAFESITGQGVIKIISAVGPPDQLAIPSQMLNMAFNTAVVVAVCVESLSVIDSLPENRMAFETSDRGYLSAGFVTFLAIRQAFEIGVDLVEITWRKLGIHHGWIYKREHQNDHY
jgi:hypothetical protein